MRPSWLGGSGSRWWSVSGRVARWSRVSHASSTEVRAWSSRRPSRDAWTSPERDRRRAERGRAHRRRGAADGHARRDAVRVLVNAAAPAEVEAALAAGAEGSACFAPSSPSWRRRLADGGGARPGAEARPRRALRPGGHRSRPRLRRRQDAAVPQGTHERGVALLLQEPEAFAAQPRAILATAGDSDLRVMLPMVRSADEMHKAGDHRRGLRRRDDRDRRRGGRRRARSPPPPTSSPSGPTTSRTTSSARTASRSRRADRGSASALGHPTGRRGRARRGLIVEVCGEAASDPAVLPLLVGLAVDELSVGAARVGLTRAHVRELTFADAQALATRSIR